MTTSMKAKMNKSEGQINEHQYNKVTTNVQNNIKQNFRVNLFQNN